MEKLLHERLREWGRMADPILTAYDGFELSAFAKEYEGATSPLFLKFADEIERCYIPRPRFEDGEPVKFGEEVGDASLIEGVPIDGICLYANGRYQLHGGDASVYYADGQPIKRPTPKVYDADGMETNRGDAVYSIKGSDRLTVKEICGGCIKVNENILSYPLSEITHERPVFDAEVVRICKGDTVWPIDSPDMKMTVDNFQHIYGQDVTVNCEFESDFYNFNSDKLTHREPDSLEKLRDDMLKAEAPFGEITAGNWADRLTALIERGAK